MTVEVAHEALIREWDQMQTWVGSVRRQLKDQTLMEDMAHNWEEHDGGLASGRQLTDFKHAGATTDQANRFLQASLKHRRHFWLGAFVSSLLLLGGVSSYIWWIEALGLPVSKGAELLLYRVGIYHPEWIPKMASIKAGSYLMGSANKDEPNHDPDAGSDEYPQHEVTIEAFNIGQYEVTFAQYCATTRLNYPDDEWGRGKQPVINVSWDDAIDYIQWLNQATSQVFRLPSEAEWEYASRAGTQGRYWWCKEAKPNFDIQPDVANCAGCKTTRGLEWIGKQTLPVGSFQENPFGLYDTAGNVEEWVQDCLHDNYQDAPDDHSAWLEADKGDCGRRMVRGGSWLSVPGSLRSAYRDWWGADAGNYGRGFRLAQGL